MFLLSVSSALRYECSIVCSFFQTLLTFYNPSNNSYCSCRTVKKDHKWWSGSLRGFYIAVIWLKHVYCYLMFTRHGLQTNSSFTFTGDSAYPMQKTLLKPLPDKTAMLERHRRYNRAHSATRVVVEHANGRLKGQWQRLRRVSVKSRARARLIVRCCIVLHNFLLKHDSVVERAEGPIHYRQVNYNNAISKREGISARFFCAERFQSWTSAHCYGHLGYPRLINFSYFA